jgi:cytoskeletal protein RodZ
MINNGNDTGISSSGGATPSIGARLRAARLNKGSSPADVAAATKLKVAFLEALESDRFAELPATFYTKSFIRMYGNHLGLDGAELAEEWSAQAIEPEEEEQGSGFTFGYHLTLMLNAVLRNKVTAVIVLVAIVLLISYCGRSERTERVPVASTASAATDQTIRDYQPVFDRNEPLPSLY